MKKQETYYKVWGEHIKLIHLLMAIVINVFFLVIALLITYKKDYEIKLVMGLSFILLSSIINAYFFKPKRNISKDLS